MSKKIIKTPAQLGNKLKAFIRVKSTQTASLGYALSQPAASITAGSGRANAEGLYRYYTSSCSR